MSFTAPHKLLTVFGTSFGGNETWSFGVRFFNAGSSTVDQATADACRAATLTLWTTANIFMPASHVLTGLKLAPIGIDGKYPPGEIAYIGDITDTPGPSNSNIHPAQSTQVATFLASTTPRGRGSHGRIYLPCPGAAISTATGQNGLANQLAIAVGAWLVAMNGVSGLGFASIMSNLGAGRTSSITSVRCDNLPDTQRRRRRQLTSVTSTVVL